MGKINKILKIGTFFFSSLALSGIILSGYLIWKYYKAESKIIPQYASILTKKGEEYVSIVNNFFDIQEQKVIELSSSPKLTTEFASFTKTTPDAQKKSIQNIEIIIKDFMAQQRKSAAFSNVMLVMPDGKIIFSLLQPKYVGLNLMQKPYSETELGYSFMRAFASLVPDISTFTYDEVLQEPALYITTPVYFNKIIIGLMIAQINQSKLYSLTENYIGLGRTGEIVTAELLDNKLQIIAPTRLFPNIAFKKMGLTTPGLSLPLFSAVNGGRGTGFGYDYRHMYILAYWDYIAKVNWGFDVKIDSDEIRGMHAGLKMLTIFIILLTLLFCLGTALSIDRFRIFLHKTFESTYKNFSLRSFSRYFSVASFILFASLSIYTYYDLTHSQSKALQEAMATAHRLRMEASQSIGHVMNKMTLLAKGMATYLQSPSVTHDDILINLKRKIEEEPSLFAMCVAYAQTDAKNTPSFAPYATRKENKEVVYQLENILKEQNISQNFMSLAWYKEAMDQKKGVWIQPTRELVSGKLVIMYAEPIFHAKDTEHAMPIGVVASMYDVSNIKKLMGNPQIGETGFGFITNKEGKFIYHPHSFFNSQETLFTEAQSDDNMALNAIDKNIVEGKEGAEAYLDLRTMRTKWISYQPIPDINWSIGIVFAQAEITSPFEKLHHQKLWLIIYLVLAFLFLAGLIATFFKRESFRNYCFASSFIFIIGILGIWSIIEPNTGVKNGAVIYNSTGLDAVIDEIDLSARQRHEQVPILLPTGIFIESWSIPSSTKVDITGSIWQLYNKKKHENIKQDIYLPEATYVRYENPYTHTSNDETTVSWSMNATLAQQFDYSKFPLDSQRIRIILDHVDKEKNILLVPDLQSYPSISPIDFPGMEKDFTYYGFKIKRSFFSLEKTAASTDYGIDAYKSISEHYKLFYNIIITRDLLNSLIVYFLPLFVILFSLFAIFVVTGKTGKSASKTFVSLGSYTGLLFALVALNVALRSQYPSGTVLYIEYFFFYTYITLLILIVHGAFVQAEAFGDYIYEKVTPIMKNLFWPVQLGVWFITTVIVFYN